jgi:hypothetical protein
LAWRLLRQEKLGVRGYTIEQTLAFAGALHLVQPEHEAEPAEFLAVVMQSPGGRKLLVFHYVQGWYYRIYELD